MFYGVILWRERVLWGDLMEEHVLKERSYGGTCFVGRFYGGTCFMG